ncbi:thioredoxin-disulfide reductase [Candidatus Woesebacteria bacterium RIFOXYB1_FULL_38_16]|uniref:Thioredoxin reductase n=1 Tax=Candidatus Woesebacteria bacterium RIFOXYB1_FULL_38_16 TaxID=1802538 RepID=A0A1F8CUA2_9BACT|nr:MAG: thioredoxin-disulfide reductase [Candidatus Woesebacteria bacterium RIFOXYA1_FULL_38_9]OGM79145.1 MAG: thioredoxin-disulfide reductase [Candidatus Woesebacteria bacterium RIFOXYB1_FULL_38_16]
MKDIFASSPKPNEPWDIVIIGSGPAAFTAAIYTTRGAASTLILAGERWGGQLMLTTTVDNFPGFPKGIEGPDLMQLMRTQAERFGTKVIEKNVSSVELAQTPFKLTAGGVEYLAKTILIATGSATRWLNIPGEEKLRGRGVGSCAPCDAPFFKDKTVVVIGGGDSAMEEALVLTKYALKVTIIHRGSEFRASSAMQEKVKKNPKITTLFNTEVKEFIGENKLEKVILFDNQTKKASEILIDGAFIAIGHTPASDIFHGKILLDEKGYIKQGHDPKAQMQTTVPGVFTAGDIHDFRYKQAVSAAGFGCIAALEILYYLDNIKA